MGLKHLKAVGLRADVFRMWDCALSVALRWLCGFSEGLSVWSSGMGASGAEGSGFPGLGLFSGCGSSALGGLRGFVRSPRVSKIPKPKHSRPHHKKACASKLSTRVR